MTPHTHAQYIDEEDERTARVNKYRRFVTYISPVAFILLCVFAVAAYEQQSKQQQELFIENLCRSVEKYHSDEASRRQLTYEFVLRDFEDAADASNMPPALRAERIKQIEQAYKPIPNDPDCSL